MFFLDERISLLDVEVYVAVGVECFVTGEIERQGVFLKNGK